MSLAAERVKVLGGNAFKITKVKKPDLLSTCWRVWGDAYAVAGTNYKLEVDTSANPDLPADADYALLFVYRPGTFVFGLTGYQLHLDDMLLGKITNNTARSFKIYKEGNMLLQADTDMGTSVSINIEHGHSYYVAFKPRGGIDKNLELQVIKNSIGREEYKEVSEKK